MCNKKGFSLLSFLLYLTFFSLIMFFMGRLITELILPSFISLRKHQSIIKLYIAADFFMRDVRSINHMCLWKIINSQELIWQHHNENEAVGWSISQNSLERKEGTYKGNWKNVKKSIISQDIAHATFSVKKDKEGGVIGIKLIITSVYSVEKPIICYVALKK